MSEIKHTPGPWKAVSVPNFENGLVYTSVQPVEPDPATMRHLLMAGGEYHVCRMTHTAAMHKVEMHRANARLIAAAPQMKSLIRFHVGNCPVCKGTGKAVDIMDMLGAPEGIQPEPVVCARCGPSRRVLAEIEASS